MIYSRRIAETPHLSEASFIKWESDSVLFLCSCRFLKVGSFLNLFFRYGLCHDRFFMREVSWFGHPRRFYSLPSPPPSGDLHVSCDCPVAPANSTLAPLDHKDALLPPRVPAALRPSRNHKQRLQNTIYLDVFFGELPFRFSAWFCPSKPREFN